MLSRFCDLSPPPHNCFNKCQKNETKVFEEVWLMFGFGQKYRRCSEAPSFVATDLNFKTIKTVALILL